VIQSEGNNIAEIVFAQEVLRYIFVVNQKQGRLLMACPVHFSRSFRVFMV
jgi:hypothetical protein